ncbi:putative autophagy regulatory protein Atg2 [Aspergillus puulaauensis]|uniref:Autophagy-related protein 2 n=1 Tax=Aspergillus puulaauensis TaxID=1220207 RepID=A0A7R7XMQ4_9EURO|nr:autophagy-related protein 2 [Aspergillus puulaauensis]BCS24382.1 autophagy-related protein 2 [Aspergillus puulaauensis]
MAYFLPSFFQKRLLKYALSRLEFVDTEALDPDNLGIRWGQRSTVELRDVGLRLEKLATILHLPTSSKLLSARIRFLKLTIPADIYSSGIICEASGIEVHLRLPSEKEAFAAKDNIFSVTETIIPNPTDLAASFLQTEPKEEKEELQAAISSRSEILHRSESISDDEEELGLGNETVSLPSFVASFLKGVSDRLQVHVDDISIRLDVETKQDGPSKRQPEEKPDLISGLLTVRQVSVGAVTTASAEDERPLHLGKRPVSLSGIDLSLISEPVVFSNYSRFTTPTSPTTPIPSKSSRPSSPASSIPPAPSSVSSSTHAMMASTIFEPAQHSITPAEDEPRLPRLEESVYTYDGRFSDADTEENRSYRHLGESQNFSDEEKLLDDPTYLDSVIDSHLQDDDPESFDDVPPYFTQDNTDESTPRLQDSGLQIFGAGALPLRPTSNSGTVASEPNIQNSQSPHYGDGVYSRTSVPNLSPQQAGDIANNKDPASQLIPENPSETSSSSSASGYFNDEQLSESKLFSNEEAQSMYMSAMSHDSDSRSFVPNIPGGWESPESTLTDISHHAQPDEATGVSHGEQDTTPVSTPKPADLEETNPLGQSAFSNARDVYTEATDKSSIKSSSDVNETTDIAKRFFHIDRVTIWIPSTKHGEQDTSDSFHSEPGSHNLKDTSAHLAASHMGEKSVSFKAPPYLRPRRDSQDSAFTDNDIKSDAKPDLQSSALDNNITIDISCVEIQFDISIGWLVVKFGQRIFQSFGGNEQTTANRKPPKTDVQDPQALSLTLNKFSIKFVEHVPGNPFPPQKQPMPSTSFLDFLHDDIVLQASASGLKATFSSSPTVTKFHAELSKLTIGFASEDLMSFSEDLKMRESTRDVQSPVSNDISFTLSRSREHATLSVSTLPLFINLNIPRLDEVLGWFGGLSTIMELGGSISSISGNKGPKKESPKRARGVRFEGSSPPPARSQNTGAPWKVNARVGGIALDITGENHYLTLRTTAAKIVSRFEGIAVQIDKAKLSGPCSLHDSRDAPAKVSLNNIRVEYLYTPKEPDLDRLLSLITPSKDKYDEDDDIMIDTLFRQRKQGSVLRATVSGTKVVVTRPELEPLQQLGEELGRLSNVTKYLPEDDRPGILTLALLKEVEIRLHAGGKIGTITANLEHAEAAHISIPSLVAAQLNSISVFRNGNEELVGEALPRPPGSIAVPALMVRFIADEMDPTIKVKLHNLRVEYSIPAITALLGISDDMTSGDVAANMASSLANIAELHPPPQESPKVESSGDSVKPTKIKLDMRDCVIGLNPRGASARGLLVLTHSTFGGTIQDILSSEATLDLRKAFIMIIDNVDNIDTGSNLNRRKPITAPQGVQVQTFADMGYVLVSSISSATATVKIMRLGDDGTKSIDVEVRDDLLILETCADSTQTLISIMNGLQPPSPPSQGIKYRTEVVPIQDMLDSFSGDAYAAQFSGDGTGNIDDNARPGVIERAGIPEDDELDYVTDFYPQPPPDLPAFGSNELGDSFQSQYHMSSSVSELDFREDHFAQKSSVGGTAHRWDSVQNTYGLSDDSKLENSPLRIRVRDAHVIWNLFDGYDWQRTRDTISNAVKNVEQKAIERRHNSRSPPGFEEEEEDVIGDCLFNSIYIGIPANKDPSELRGEINRNIDDLASETGSYATTSTVTTTRQNASPTVKGKRLRLSRSRNHKMTFELKGIGVDMIVFPPGSGETVSSLDVRVKELEIFDHVPTSTWKKFATYMREAGEKESGASMVHLEILTVKPVTELGASELVLKATVLPLRLHVDQDALDFLTRFFEFRDDSAPPGSPQEPPFLQRSEVNAIPVKLDFKPKRVDYAGLRSGRTTELMNFFILEEADMVLKHVIAYGQLGFDKLGQTLNDVWMPEIKSHQLPGILGALAPIRSLVNVGSGMRDLVVVPMREYRKDGRIVRSIQKGAFAFAKTTSNELVKLGAKLAIGTQTVLQDAEELLTTTPARKPTGGDEDEMSEEEVAKKISLYADQPVGVVQGLRGAFRGLERDLVLTRDAIIAVPGEVQESGSAKAAARAVLKRAPTLILRPAIGVSKAVGQTLLGAGNSMDPSNRRKIEDKYKRH